MSKDVPVRDGFGTMDKDIHGRFGLVLWFWFGLVWFCICFCFQFNSDPELLACLLNRIFCMLEMQGIITGYGAC